MENSSLLSKLSKGGIHRLLQISTKGTFPVDECLQVLLSKVTYGPQNGNIITATLSDSEYCYDKFFMPEKVGGPVKDGDFIKLKSVQRCATNGKLFVKVLKFEVTDINSNRLGTPYQIEQEKYLSEIEKASASNTNGNGSNSKSNEVKKESSKQTPNPVNTTTTSSNKTVIQSTSDGKPTKHFHYKLSQLTTFTKDLAILVRCMKRTEKKTYKTSKGTDCTVFNFVVMDSENTEMQISCFGKIADKFYPVIIEGKMYELIGGYVKVNDHKYNFTKADYQINLNEHSQVYSIEDSGDICEINPTVTNLNELVDLKVYTNIDFVAVVTNVNEKATIKTKKGEMVIKKTVVLDDSEYKVDFTLWKSHAETDLKPGDIILVKNAKVGEYSGKNLSASEETQLIVNPNFKSIKNKILAIKRMLNVEEDCEGRIPIPEDILKGFKTFQSEQTKAAKTLFEIKMSNLKEAYCDVNEKSHKVKAYITQFNHGEKNFYPGCSQCKKKLVLNEDVYRCNTCNKDNVEPNFTYTVTFRVKDCTSDQFVDCYGPVAEKILQVSADNYKNYLANDDQEALKTVCDNAEFNEFLMQVKVRTQTFNNNVKRKLHIISAEKVSVPKEVDRLLRLLELNLKKN